MPPRSRDPPDGVFTFRLVGGLASENVRWAESVKNFKSQGVTLCGDVLLISAFVSYVGYFTKKYRNELMEKFWVPYIHQLKVRGWVTFTGQEFWGVPGVGGGPPHGRSGHCVFKLWPSLAEADALPGGSQVLRQDGGRAGVPGRAACPWSNSPQSRGVAQRAVSRGAVSEATSATRPEPKRFLRAGPHPHHGRSGPPEPADG